MRLHPIAIVGSVLLLASSAHAAAADPKTDDEKALYALGVAVAQNVAAFNLSAAELEMVKAGFGDGAQGKQKLEPNAYFPKLREMQKTRMAAVAQATLDKAAAEKGAKKMPSGLIITTLKKGTGATPKATDTVKVHYHGTLPDGRVFDSSVDRKEPATFPLNGVIPCWTEGVQMIKVGGKSKLVCPASIAYGEQGSPPTIAPGATLIFEVELLNIEAPAKAAAPKKP